MHVLVVGGNGLLGSSVVAAAVDRSHSVSMTYHSRPPEFDLPSFELDLRDEAGLRDVIRTVDPDLVVNCAAMTDVDGCESASEEAHAVNADAPERIAELSSDLDFRFVHYSTDYVFDGQQRDRYGEDAEPNPIQVYGESKLAGERAVVEADPTALVPRLSFVYGCRGDTGALAGFPAWVDGELAAGNRIPLFTDQWITPSRAGDIAGATFDLVDREASGLVHLASRSCVTPYEFGQQFAELRGHDRELIDEGSMADVDRAAARPSYTCLDTARAESLLDARRPTVREDLTALTQSMR
ncbi:dTDP-4-dehydrorhamnose reductase [Halobaculum sp. EA56]|uniref:dTDP-4-dehydrorhamnose reductase n=1 Tax=Halobaculum sp. EA56 TaxID=3421648 RepID=UPI003EBA11C4